MYRRPDDFLALVNQTVLVGGLCILRISIQNMGIFFSVTLQFKADLSRVVFRCPVHTQSDTHTHTHTHTHTNIR